MIAGWCGRLDSVQIGRQRPADELNDEHARRAKPSLHRQAIGVSNLFWWAFLRLKLPFTPPWHPSP
jgi:hypothetical protein